MQPLVKHKTGLIRIHAVYWNPINKMVTLESRHKTGQTELIFQEFMLNIKFHDWLWRCGRGLAGCFWSELERWAWGPVKVQASEPESPQLRAMSHPGMRISSLTKAHRHQRVRWVCVAGGPDSGQTQSTSMTGRTRLADLFLATGFHKSPTRPCSLTHHYKPSVYPELGSHQQPDCRNMANS